MNSYFVGHRFLNKAIMLLSAIAFILILIQGFSMFIRNLAVIRGFETAEEEPA